MHFPAKPSLDEVRLFLAKHQALVVHFSGTPKGIGPGQETYPKDLIKVCSGGAQGGISCSVVKPGDRFHGDICHGTGSVGLVIALNGANSLVAVSEKDVGSYVENGVRLGAKEVDIETADLENSLSARGERYNEWIVRDFEVIGMFVAVPASTWQEAAVKTPPDFPPLPPQGQPVSISLHQIAADFKELPIYTFSRGEISKWDATGWSPVTHDNVYS